MNKGGHKFDYERELENACASVDYGRELKDASAPVDYGRELEDASAPVDHDRELENASACPLGRVSLPVSPSVICFVLAVVMFLACSVLTHVGYILENIFPLSGLFTLLSVFSCRSTSHIIPWPPLSLLPGL